MYLWLMGLGGVGSCDVTPKRRGNEQVGKPTRVI